MQCDQMQGLLSEYLDHALDDERRGRMDAHLLTCAHCRRELEALQALVGRLNALPTLKAPAGFLNRIHARQSNRFDLGRVIKTLFVPIRIKLPLEFATATIMAVLIVFLVGIQQREMPLSHDMALAPAGVPAEKKDAVNVAIRAAAPETVSDEREEYAPAPAPMALESAGPPAPTVSRVPAAPTPAVRPNPAVEAIHVALLLKKAPMVRAEGHPEQASRRAAPSVSPSAPARQAAMKLAEQDRGHGDHAPMVPDHAGQAMGPPPARPVEERALAAIRKAVHGLGGKVLSVQYGPPPIRARLLTVEIPAAGYAAFGAGLKDMGDMAAPLPALDRKAGAVRLVISLAETQ